MRSPLKCDAKVIATSYFHFFVARTPPTDKRARDSRTSILKHTLVHLLDYILLLFIAVRGTHTSFAVGLIYILTKNLLLSIGCKQSEEPRFSFKKVNTHSLIQSLERSTGKLYLASTSHLHNESIVLYRKIVRLLLTSCLH